jgi:mannose-1-phosphate guanylyltransferase
VLEFREKPTELVPGDVNAGTYVLDPSALEGWPAGDSISIEREIFPSLIAGGRRVFGFLSDAYWMDLGTPEKYLRAHVDVLEGRIRGIEAPAPCVADGATVDPSARLGPMVVVGPEAVVGAGARIDESVLHAGAEVGSGAEVERSILAAGSVVGGGATVRRCVLGQDARVPEALNAEDERVDAGAVATGAGPAGAPRAAGRES